jgi:hypothetical protein
LEVSHPIYYLPDIIISGETSGSWNFSNIPGIKVVNDSINLSQVAVVYIQLILRQTLQLRHV